MPAALNNMQFPLGYQPWYVFDAALVDTPTAFDKFDVLVPTSGGKFNRAANNAVLDAGYVVALEKFATGMKSIQVATAGSLIPGILSGATRPGGLLKIALTDSDGMRFAPANAADLAAGRCVGRFRNSIQNSRLIQSGAEDDLIAVLLGVL